MKEEENLSGQRISRDAVHRVLYRRADRHGRLRIQANTMAEELGVSYWNFTRIIHRMMDEGRLRRISGSVRGPKTFVVADPATWKTELP